MHLILFLIVGLMFFFMGMFAHHCIYREEHVKALQRMETARDKHNHYAERYKQEAMKAYKDGVDTRTQEKLQSYERSYNR